MGRQLSPCSVFVLLSFLSTLSPVMAAMEVAPLNYIQDKFQTSSDLITHDLIEKYLEIEHKDFWQPHAFIPSTTSREIVHVDNVEKRYVEGKYLQWKCTRLGLHHYIIGITTNSIVVFGADLTKITSIASTDTLISFTVFSRWNYERNYPEVIIPVATRKKGIDIYRLENNIISKVNSGFPLPYDIKTLEYCHVGVSTKLVVVPSQSNYPVDIYNIEINKTEQVWFHQRLPGTDGSHVAVYELGSESYIAIASHKSITIYAYDSEKGLYTISQTIHLSFPSTQLVSFSIAYKKYLASVPVGADVEFFGYNGHQYTREDTIAQIQALQIHGLNLEDYRDEHFILSKGSNGRIQILEFDGSKFKNEYSDCSKDICSSEADLGNGAGFTVNDTSYYMLPSPSSNSRAEVLVITKSTEELVSPLYKTSVDAIEELRALFLRYQRWESIVENTKNTLLDLLSLTQTNTITGHWNLKTLQSSSIVIRDDQTTQVTNDYEETQFIFSSFSFLGLKWLDIDFNVKLSDIDNQISYMREVVTEAKAWLKDSIPLNSDEVHLVRAEQRVTGTFTAAVLYVDTIDTPAINYQQNLNQFFSSFVLKDNIIEIGTPILFNGYLTISNLYAQILNTIPVKNIARLSKSNHFTYNIDFNEYFIVNGDIKVTRINGIDFSQEIIRISDISDVKFMDGLVSLKGATLASPVDSVEIRKEIFEKILLRSTSQKISVPFSFTGIQTEGAVKITTLNGDNFLDFVTKIIKSDHSGVIRGHKIVTGGVNSESLFIEGFLNKYKFPEDLVTTSQKRLIISGYKNLTQLTASKVLVDGTVDGIYTNDIVSRSDYETLSSTWVFEQGVVFLDDVTVKGYVDGIKMESLKHTDTLDQYKSSYYPNADIEFLQPVYFKNLKIDETINGKAYDDIFNGLLTFDSREVRIEGATFQKSISIGELQLNSGILNNINLDDIFTLSSSQNISGHKEFGEKVNFASLYALDTFDSVKLSGLLEEAFRLSKARTISSLLSFEEIFCSKIKVEGPINNFKSFASAVAVTTGRSEQIFETPVEFQHFVTEKLNVTRNLEIGNQKIGGMNFNSWNQRRISLSKDLQFSVPVKVLGNVKTRGSLETKKINEIFLSYLNSGVLRTDRPEQTFTNTFKTSGPIIVENGVILFQDEISGYHIEKVISEAIPLTSGNKVTITGDWTFESLLVSSELIVNGKTCGVDLARLDVDSVRKGESDIEISGEKTFLYDIEVKEDLRVNRINSEDLFSNVFTLNTSQVITGSIHFERNVFVEGELISDGYINEVSLLWLASVYAFENGSTHVLTSDIDAEGTLDSNSLNVYGLLQGNDMKKFFLTIVNVNDKAMRITGHKTVIPKMIVEGNMDVGTLNGVDVYSLNSIFRCSDNIQFTAPVIFSNLAEVPTLRLEYGDIKANGLVGDVNLTELVAEAAYLNSRHSLGSLSFASVVVLGNIENVKLLNDVLLEDVIRLDKPQRLEQLNVKEALLNGRNVRIEGLMSGYDLLREYENTLFKKANRPQIVTGAKELLGQVQVKGNLYCLGALGLQLVHLSSDRVLIESQVEFTKSMIVEGDFSVTKLINGHSLQAMVDNSLTNGRTETISGYWTFAEGVTFKDKVTGTGQLDGFDIGEVIDAKKAEAQTAELDFEAEKLYFEERCTLLDTLYQRVAQSPIKLEFFDKHQQTILLKQRIKSLIYIRAGNLTRILTASETCDVGSLEWDASPEQFVAGTFSPRLGEVTEWESVSHQDFGILAYRSTESSCSSSVGVYALTMDKNGLYGPKETLLSGNFYGIQLIHHQIGAYTLLFVIGENQQTIHVFLWDEVTSRFQLQKDMTFERRIHRFKVMPFNEWVGIFYHSEYSVHFELFNWKEQSVKTLGQMQFVAGSVAESSKGMIQAFQILNDRVFGFLQTSDSVISSDCNLQVFKLENAGMELFQRIKSQFVVSMKPIHFGKEEYLALLTKHSGIHIYRYLGMSGFEALEGSPIRVPDGHEFITFNLELWSYKLPRPFIVVSTGRSIEILHSSINGDLIEYPGRSSVCYI